MSRRTTGPEIERLIQLLAKLPGLGPRSARRAALHLIKNREKLLVPLAAALAEARDKVDGVLRMRQCRHGRSVHPVPDPRRDRTIICVVEEVGDLWALERAGAMERALSCAGRHTVGDRGGAARRICRSRGWSSGRAGGGVKEVVLAVNATVEGQTTAHYITDRLKDLDDPALAARPWRAGRRRARLSRRRHAHRRHAGPPPILKQPTIILSGQRVASRLQNRFRSVCGLSRIGTALAKEGVWTWVGFQPGCGDLAGTSGRRWRCCSGCRRCHSSWRPGWRWTSAGRSISRRRCSRRWMPGRLPPRHRGT